MKSWGRERGGGKTWRRVMWVLLLGLALGTGGAWGQGAGLPAFEVVAVKASKPDQVQMRSLYTPTGLSVMNASLVILLRQAYGLFHSNDDQIVGLPAWAEKAHFDIEAKVAAEDTGRLAELTRDERGAMLRALLRDRFGLVAHEVTREGPVYALAVSKHGAKLKAAVMGDVAANGLNSEDKRAGGRMQMENGHLQAWEIGMDGLVGVLTQETGRTVLDRTGLTGKYDFALDWTPNEAADAGKADAAPDLFTAVEEQLGLRLEATRGPVPGLVVERVTMPGAN